MAQNFTTKLNRMKKFLLSIAVCAAAFSSNAQIPDYGVWPAGVVFTDINGNQHDIDAILDAGQSVVIDAFADWCGPCWTYHQGHTLENVHQALGAAGTDVARVFGVEASASTPESNISDANTGLGDWTVGVTYPLINDNSLAGIINLSFYPTLILICPDRSVTEVGQKNEAQWTAAIGNCASAPTNTNDPKLVGHNCKGSFVCGTSTTADVELKVMVQNYTSVAMNGTYTIRVMDGATEIATTNANLNMGAFELTEVNVGTVALPLGTSNLTAEITTANDDPSNDQTSVSVTNTLATAISSTAADGLTMDVTFDNYAGSFGMLWDSGLPYTDDLFTLYGDAANGSINPIKFESIGTYSNGATNTAINLATATEGCYYLALFDNNGNGMVNPQDGNIHISSTNGTSYTMSTDYGYGTIAAFEVSFAANLDEIVNTADVKVYPNPAVETATVDFTVANASAQVSMVNALGQEVYSTDLGTVNGTQSVAINTSNIEAGLYLVHITIDGHTLTERISVVSK